MTNVPQTDSTCRGVLQIRMTAPSTRDRTTDEVSLPARAGDSGHRARGRRRTSCDRCHYARIRCTTSEERNTCDQCFYRNVECTMECTQQTSQTARWRSASRKRERSYEAHSITGTRSTEWRDGPGIAGMAVAQASPPVEPPPLLHAVPIEQTTQEQGAGQPAAQGRRQQRPSASGGLTSHGTRDVAPRRAYSLNASNGSSTGSNGGSIPSLQRTAAVGMRYRRLPP